MESVLKLKNHISVKREMQGEFQFHDSYFPTVKKKVSLIRSVECYSELWENLEPEDRSKILDTGFVNNISRIEKTQVFWLEDKGKLVCYFMVDNKSTIWNVFTVPCYRQKGHMKKLLNILFQFFPHIQFSLYVEENNIPAKHLYYSLGFRESK